MQELISKEGDLQDKINILEEIFSCSIQRSDAGKQLNIPIEPNSFIKKQEYDDGVTQIIINFIVKMFRDFIENNAVIPGYEHLNKYPPIIIFLDSAHLMDKVYIYIYI